MVWWLMACGGREPAVCDLEQCARFLPEAPQGGDAAPTQEGPAPWEDALVGPLLADARQGIRPWDERGIGVCRGPRSCVAYLGTDVGALAPGEYLVRAELRVPELGEPGTWAVAYRSRCEVETTAKDGSIRRRTETSELAQDVRYAGPGEGWRIEPLQVIRSPSDGAWTCSWTLEARQPSGLRVWTGSWSTPSAASVGDPASAAH